MNNLLHPISPSHEHGPCPKGYLTLKLNIHFPQDSGCVIVASIEISIIDICIEETPVQSRDFNTVIVRMITTHPDTDKVYNKV
jgi:hypothetical protein